MSNKNITGRDGYIMLKALAYAIETIDRLPEPWQEASDCEDMNRLLGHGQRAAGQPLSCHGPRAHHATRTRP
jgi:hypothetical protein